MIFAIIAVIIIGIIFFIFSLWILKNADLHIDTPQKAAGRYGERLARAVITEVFRDDDILLNNVQVFAEGKQTELDNVVINSNGIFIIEVKNWSGQLIGDVNSHDWIKTKVSSGGEFYQKTVKNPIGQVKRQIYILSKYLKEEGLDIWIDGYVFFIEMNSPIKSDYVLETQRDIDRVIHRAGRRKVSKSEQQIVVDLLNEV